MNITFISNNNINEGFGDRSSSFNNCDKVIGPDGTIYDTKQIIALVNNACEELSNMTGGLINEYLVALPIVYTFQVPTMATDSRFIYMNPGFVLELVKDCGETTMGIAFVILHEIYHNLYLHKEREAADPVKFSDHRKANAAQDYEINWIIEHTFSDNREIGQYDPDDPDDSPYEADGFTKKQLFAGVTNMCNGLINDDYAGKPWEEIYDLIPSPPKEQDDEENKEIKLPPDYKNGYRDGWEAAIRELRAKGLVESVKINDELLYKVVKLFESSNSSDYDTGYNAGYKAAMDTILSIMNPQPSGPSDPDSGPGSDGSKLPQEKIDGLTPIKPINPPIQPANSPSKTNNPNTPVIMHNSQENDKNSQSTDQNDQNGQNTAGENNQDSTNQNGNQNGEAGQDSQNTNNGGNNQNDKETSSISNTAPGQSNQSSGTTSQEQLDDIRRSGESTIKVGITDGSYTGKMSAAANDKHILSKEEGDKIRENAGVKEISNDKGIGKVKNPFDSNNLKGITEGIKRLSKIGNQGGRGINVTQTILDKILDTLTPKINWKEELRNRLDACATKLVDAGWNKKQLSYDAYSRFDDYEGEDVENIILMIDTSGSIKSDDYLMQIIREFNELAKEVNPQNVDIVLFCDGIYYHHEFDTGASIPDLRPVFRENAKSGGTTYSDCFAYIDEHYAKKGRDFACCVIFTDGDVTTASLPPKSKLKWDPGTRRDDDSKLLWFVLLDENKKIELPYGGIIQMSTRDFERSIGMSESVQIPRRSAFTINEAFRKISTQKADLETNSDSNAKRRLKELKDRLTNIQSYAYTPEEKEKLKKEIIDWLNVNTNLRIWDNRVENYNDILDINDDLLINLNPVNKKDLVIKGKALENIPNYILFGNIPGNLEIGFNRRLEYLPGAFAYATVGEDFMCTNMPNLKSLDNCPSKVNGNYIFMGCNKLETLDGAPISHNNFDGYFLSNSTKFTNDDFYDTVDNGGIMKRNNFDVKESVMPVRIQRLVESRIALGKRYNSLNEAFSSNILSRLASIPENKNAIKRMKNIRVFWSKIPDDIIIPVYNSVSKLIQTRKPANGDTSLYGLTICCDENDHIYAIATGNNRGEWTDNTWKYLNDEVAGTINDRLTLVRAANSSTLDEYAVKRSQETLTSLGIDWKKPAVQRLKPVINLSSLSFNHLYIVPEMCAHSYVIKGTGDTETVKFDDFDFMRDFNYGDQLARRDKLSRERLDNILGSHFAKDLANGPAAKKYLKYLVNDDLVREVNNAYYTNYGVTPTLMEMKDSVKTIYDRIVKELDEIKDSHLISGQTYTIIYLRLMRSTYRKFNKYIDSEIESANLLNNTTTDIHNKITGKNSFDDPDEIDKLNKGRIKKSEVLDNIKNISFKENRATNGWYYYYMITLKTFAQILSKIAAAKRGNPDVLEDYAEYIANKFNDTRTYSDKFDIISL